MADIPASNWTEADASNTTAAPDGWPEGMAPSGVNDSGRAMMGAVKRWYDWTTPKTTAGTSTAYTLSYTVAPGALVDGMLHVVLFNASCGASPTLNINTLGAIPLHYFTGAAWAAVPSGMIQTNTICTVVYNTSAGSYRIVNWSTPPTVGVTTFLGADVALTNTATFFDGPNTGSIGAAGQTWQIAAKFLLTDSAGAANFVCQIWNGSAAVDTGGTTLAFANGGVPVTLIVVVVLSGATTFTAQVMDITSTSGVLLKSQLLASTANLGSSITAIRLS